MFTQSVDKQNWYWKKMMARYWCGWFWSVCPLQWKTGPWPSSGEQKQRFHSDSPWPEGMRSRIVPVTFSSYLVKKNPKRYFKSGVNSKLYYFLFTSIYLLFICVSVGSSAMVHVWRSEEKLWVSLFSFYLVGPGDQTQVFRLGGKCLFLLSHLHDLKNSIPPPLRD